MRARRIFIATILAWSIGTDVDAQLRTSMQASGFSVPLAYVQDPTDRDIQFVVQQDGHIRAIRNVLSSRTISWIFGGHRQRRRARASRPGVRARCRHERPLLRQLHGPLGKHGRCEVQAVVESDSCGSRSRFDLRWGDAGGPGFIAQPFANHNGGHLVFGPDRYLYVGLGDGGSGNNPAHRAQNPRELLGKMLRIDVNVADSHPSGYEVPADNPFVSSGPAGTRPEIWAFGLRNPWRYSFDDPNRGGTGALVIGDVGQNRFEEIDYEPPRRGGRNYGWRNREGAHDNLASPPPAYLPLVDPITSPTGIPVSRLPGGSSTVAARSAPRFGDDTSLRISFRVGCGRSL